MEIKLNYFGILMWALLLSCSKNDSSADSLTNDTDTSANNESTSEENSSTNDETSTETVSSDSSDTGDSSNTEDTSSETDSSYSTDTTETTPEIAEEGVPAIFNKMYAASRIYLDGSFVVIKVNGAPDHKSPYYSSNSDLYEAYNGTNTAFNLNPNTIGTFDFEFKIPLNPQEASNKSATPLGAMGVALNGVSFFNQYAGPNNQPLTNEINSFDQYGGHPTGDKVYHYHVEPTYLTTAKGNDGLLGFLLDGFPVYGPEENNANVTNNDLDEYHGHSHETADYPDGIYHYHVTDADPYINGNGYFGTPGTVTK